MTAEQREGDLKHSKANEITGLSTPVRVLERHGLRLNRRLGTFDVEQEIWFGCGLKGRKQYTRTTPCQEGQARPICSSLLKILGRSSLLNRPVD